MAHCTTAARNATARGTAYMTACSSAMELVKTGSRPKASDCNAPCFWTIRCSVSRRKIRCFLDSNRSTMEQT